MANEIEAPSVYAKAKEVMNEFLILPLEPFIGKLEPYSTRDRSFADAVALAIEGLSSTIGAASLPFHLVSDSVVSLRFDRFHSSERILALRSEEPGSGLSPEGEVASYAAARRRMDDFTASPEGGIIIRDQIVVEMYDRLQSPDVRRAAEELRVQTLISTWSILESFVRTLVTKWINENPNSALVVMSLPELKEFFGKQALEIKTIGEHGFDLSASMGTILLRNRRLAGLGIIRSLLSGLFQSSNLSTIRGEALWLLNQQRNLFVHNRGIVDQEYLAATGGSILIGQRLPLACSDIERYLTAVRDAIIEVCDAASSVKKP